MGGNGNKDKEKTFDVVTTLFGHDFSPRIPDAVYPIVGGCLAFGSTLAVSTLIQKAIGVSTATQLIPTLFGVTTVCAASLISERVSIETYEFMKQQDPKKRNIGYLKHKIQHQISDSVNGIIDTSSQQLRGGIKRGKNKLPQFNLPMHEIRVCLLGLLAFKSLGGRFWAISPSSLTHLGSFARWSIPCTENYATPTQRTMVEQMGRKWGCHTCGSHMLPFISTPAKSAISGKTYRFVGDHMPPKSVAKHMNEMWIRKIGLLSKVRFRFYPQCVSCSQTQGSILSKAGSNLAGLSRSKARASSMLGAGGGRNAHFHGFRPRLNHLVGGVVAATTVVGVENEKEITSKGNRKRFERWQNRIEKYIIPHFR